jgi:hypothetical protein
MPPVSVLSLRTYTAFTVAGDQLGIMVPGHELDTTEPDTFRVFRTLHGQRFCVAVFNRQAVSAVCDVTEETDEPTG